MNGKPVVLSLLLLLALARIAPAASFDVTTAAELISAVATANSTPGPDDITLEPGTYSVGLLQVTDTLSLLGPNTGRAVIEGGFQVSDPAVSLILDRLTIRDGDPAVDFLGQHLGLSGVTTMRSTGQTPHMGVWVRAGTAAFTDCTFTGGDPGVRIDANVVADLLDVTITQNPGLNGGIQMFGTVRPENTLIAMNPSGDCKPGRAVFGGGHNLDSDGTCWETRLNGLTTTNPGLAPLDDNGGQTPTARLLAGSAAINSGGGCAAFDQREVPRPQEGVCDVGAFETTGAIPYVLDFSPPSGSAGSTVTVFGSGFSGATSADVNGTPAQFVVIHDSKLQLTVPGSATSGPITVSAGGMTSTSFDDFIVVVASPPVVTSFTPSSGPVGTPVSISGSSFSSATAVTIGGASAAFTIVSDNAITATVPAAAVSGRITVTSSAGTGTSSTAFTVLNPPTIGSFTPSFGVEGATVVIQGSSFSTATIVTFDGVPAAFTIVSDSQITTQVPIGATSGAIAVTNAAGTATSASTFIVAYDVASGTVGAGGTVSTLLPATEATSTDPVETSVTTPIGGTIDIREEPGIGGFGIIGQRVHITVSPWATAANPLVIVFNIDASVIPAGQSAATIVVMKDNVVVPPCTAPGGATPDPCVFSRQTIGNDAVITIRSSSASDWDFSAGQASVASGRAHGAGRINSGHFDFNVSQNAGEAGKGHLHFDDGEHRIAIETKRIASLSVQGNTAKFTGVADGVTFTVEVTGNSKHGGDTFSITLSNGYTATGTLISGSIKVE